MEEEAPTYEGEYLGGHAMYPSKLDITLSLRPTELVVEELDLHIRYSAIKEVKNVDESHIKALRVIAFGVVGALWKKKETYLCIVYNDGIQDQNPVFRINYLDQAQREIYQHVIRAKATAGIEENTKIKPAMSIPKHGENWKCSRCQRINSPKAKLCTRCGSERPRK